MTPSNDERARRREERLEAERRAAAADRRRRALGYVVAGGLALAVLVGLVVALSSGGDTAGGGGASETELPEEASIEPLSGSPNGFEPDARTGTEPPPLEQGDLKAAARDAGCDLRLDLADEGATHIREDDPAPSYKTNPPTSGDHVVPPQQQADGAYAEYPDPIYTVHALEHGRVTIQYSPDLPEEDQLALKGVFDENPSGILLFPNPGMPYEIAATAWTQLLGCDSFEGQPTLDAIRNLRDTYVGNGPEAVPVQLSG